MELLFHEQRIEGPESRQIAPYLRAALPPFILESDDNFLPLHVWIKIFSDGIFILSFQLDATWDGIEEEDWIPEIINLFQRYFKSVWVDAKIQKSDADQLLPALHQEISIAGQTINNRKTRKLQKEVRRRSKTVLDDALNKEGTAFEIGESQWILHEIAGSDQQEKWESTIDLCRSQYVNAIASLIVSTSRKEVVGFQGIHLWQGRPAVSLMRFREQPSSKDILLKKFGASISRILVRSAHLDTPPELPQDLRPFGDYCFHGNRALLLWTWLRPEESPDDAWKDPNTHTLLSENQARAEHFEYYNMRVSRACSIAGDPPSYMNLVDAYETLVATEETLHKSSQAGEISDALSYLMTATGTADIIPSGKERARWKLDEYKYRFENRRTQIDRWLGFVFGLVGVNGFADLVIKPIFLNFYPKLINWEINIYSFFIAVFVVGILSIPIWFFNRKP
ncbi:MAG: hypothetical protein HGB15_10300 [Chlorobaculum sp.]|nr:hypothetical protein [Chlorobaculum sp.]